MAQIAVLLLFLASLGVACVPAKKSNASTSSPVVIEVKVDARQFGYTPTEIRVKAGDRFRLLVTSVDVDHRLTISGITPERETVQGRLQTIEMTAWPAGTYEFVCHSACGLGHYLMKGRLIIE